MFICQKIEIDQEMLQHLTEIFQSELRHLKNSFLETQINRDVLQINLENQMKILCNYIQQKQSLCRDIIQKSVEVFQQFKNYLKQQQNIKKDYQQKKRQHERECLRLSDKVRTQQELYENIEHLNEELRKRNSELEDKFVQIHNKYLSERESCEQKLKQKNMTLQQQIKRLVLKNQRLKNELNASKGQETNLSQIINEKDKLVIQLQQELEKYQKGYYREKSRNQELAQKLDEKQNMIATLRKQKRNEIKHRIQLYRKQSQDHFEKRKSQINIQSGNLLDQLGNNRMGVQSNNFFSFAQVLMQRSESGQSESTKEAQQIKDRFFVDPYYAHFVLISQSIKIKEQNEQYLSVDIKKYYEQIIDNRIPMHIWDEWIKNKMKQVAKIQKMQKSRKQNKK